jgi:hypothetical protein
MCGYHEKLENEHSRRSRLTNMLSKRPFSAPELFDVPWEETEWIHRFPGGDPQSSGIFVFQTSDRLLVLKPGSVCSAGELFCAKLYKQLGIVAPEQRLVTSEDEYSRVKVAVQAAKFVDQGDKDTLVYYLRNPYCTVSEYCPSVALHELASLVAAVDGAQHTSLSRNIYSFPENQTDLQTRELLSSSLDKFLHQLGVVLAADILVNNGDRCPSIHRDRQHKGNPGNIIVSKGNGCEVHLIAVDNNTNGICDAAGCLRYYECVADFAKDICSTKEDSAQPSDIQVLQNVVSFVQENTGLDIREAGFSVVQAGVFEGMSRIAAAFEENELVFGEFKRDISEEFRIPMQISTQGLKKSGVPGSSGELAWRGVRMINIPCIKEVARRISLEVKQRS